MSATTYPLPNKEGGYFDPSNDSILVTVILIALLNG